MQPEYAESPEPHDLFEVLGHMTGVAEGEGATFPFVKKKKQRSKKQANDIGFADQTDEIEIAKTKAVSSKEANQLQQQQLKQQQKHEIETAKTKAISGRE